MGNDVHPDVTLLTNFLAPNSSDNEELAAIKADIRFVLISSSSFLIIEKIIDSIIAIFK